MVAPNDIFAAGLLKALLKAGLLRPFVSYFDVASAALFLYDYLLTLSMEVEYIWGSPWNVIKIVFLIQRYMPFLDICVLTMWRQLGLLTRTQCVVIPYVTGFSFLIGFAFSELLLSLRVWALYDRSKRIAIFLPIFALAIWLPSFYSMYLYVVSLRYSISPIASHRGCIVIAARDVVIWAWVGLLIWNTVTLLLTLAHVWRSYQSGVVSRLASVIYKDGAYYYVYLFFFSGLNILFTLSLPPSKRVVILSVERVMHSMFASRVLLHMRAQAKPKQPEYVNSGPVAFYNNNVIDIGKNTAVSSTMQTDTGYFTSTDYEMKDLEKD